MSKQSHRSWPLCSLAAAAFLFGCSSTDLNPDLKCKFERVEVTVDLTSRVSLSDLDHAKGKTSTTLRVTRILRSGAECGVDELRLPHATGGRELKLVGTPKPNNAQFLRAEHVLVGPLLDNLYRGAKSLWALARGIKPSQLRNYQFVAPLSDHAAEISYTLEYVNGFQGVPEEWMGWAAAAATSQLLLTIVFPGDMEISNNIRFEKGNPRLFRRRNFKSVASPKVVMTEDRQRLVWTIQGVAKGEAYRVLWRWKQKEGPTG